MALFNEKWYNTESMRLKGWDYGSNGYYFITFCAKDRAHFFGEIEFGKMILNDIGLIAETNWQNIPKQFKYAFLDEFIIMPNHVHGIVIIDKKGGGGDTVSRDAINRISTTADGITTQSKRNNRGGFAKEYNPMLHENLSRIIRWYKGKTTFDVRKVNQEFGWQTLFYDHIVRNEKSLHHIRAYIKRNPIMWQRDRNNFNGLRM